MAASTKAQAAEGVAINLHAEVGVEAGRLAAEDRPILAEAAAQA